MTKHLTVRMAWHDNRWNGKVCLNPEGNTYCTGAHSLLSGRIKKTKMLRLNKRRKASTGPNGRAEWGQAEYRPNGNGEWNGEWGSATHLT